MRGCGVGAADSFCIIHQNSKFVNSENRRFFDEKFVEKATKEKKKLDAQETFVTLEQKNPKMS